MVITNNISVQKESKTLLDSVSCSLIDGRITSFIGKSGAGKTTLLKSLVGLTPITQGTITINNQPISTLTHRQRSEMIGYVFQDFNLFPHFTVLQNCIDPLIVHGTTYNQAEQKALAMLEQFEMEQFAHVLPHELSGGQKQRVAIARSLGLHPQVLLLDEPTASLDPINTEILVTLLQKLARNGLTIAISSQDMLFVRKIFDRVYYIQAGKIIELCEGIDQLSSCPAIEKFL